MIKIIRTDFRQLPDVIGNGDSPSSAKSLNSFSCGWFKSGFQDFVLAFIWGEGWAANVFFNDVYRAVVVFEDGLLNGHELNSQGKFLTIYRLCAITQNGVFYDFILGF